jgi:hypothetical protein
MQNGSESAGHENRQHFKNHAILAFLTEIRQWLVRPRSTARAMRIKELNATLAATIASRGPTWPPRASCGA